MTSREKWITIRKQIGTKCFKIYPETGSILVGNEDFAVNINNHVGDEATRVAVIGYGEVDTSLMTFEKTINCKNVHIFFHDTADRKARSNPAEWAATLNGRYGVFVYQDIMVFEKWND